MITTNNTSNISLKLKDQVTYALNMINSNTEGNRGAKSIEPGYVFLQSLEGTYRGHIEGEDEIFIFLSNGELLGIKQNVVTSYFKDSRLNLNYTIDATYRLKNGCERVIYWVDHINSDRFINLDRLDLFLNGDELILDKIELQPNIKTPYIHDTSLNTSGGILEYGSYSFVVELLDSFKNVIKRSTESLPIEVFNNNQIGKNLKNTPALTGGKPTFSGSIEINIRDIDTDFSFVQITALIKDTGDGLTQSAYKLNDLIPVSNTIDNYIFTGISNLDELIPVGEVLIPIVSYKSSKTITQVQNRLIRGNVKESNYNWEEMQKAASKVGVTYVAANKRKGSTFLPDSTIALGIVYITTEGIESPPIPLIGTPKNTDPRTCSTIQDNGVFNEACLKVRLEFITNSLGTTVVDFIIKYKKNGILVEKEYNFSPSGINAFTIIGQDIDCGDITEVELEILQTTNVQFLSEDVTLNVESITTQYEGVAPLDGWDDTVYPEWSEDMSFLIDIDTYKKLAGDLYGKTDLESLQALKEIKELPTRSDIYNTFTSTSQGGVYRGRLGYVESKDYTYNTPKGYCGEDYWGEDLCGNKLLGTPIRHFKMPSRTVLPDNLEIALEFFNITYPDNVVGHYFVKSEPIGFSDSGYIKRLVKDDNNFYQQHLLNQDFEEVTDYYNSFTPSTLINGSTIDANYLKVTSLKSIETKIFSKKVDLEGGGNNDLQIYHRQMEVIDSRRVSRVNYNIDYNIVLKPNKFLQDSEFSFFNISQANPANILKLDTPIQNNQEDDYELIKTVYIRYIRNPYSNLDSIKWSKIENGYDVNSNSSTVFSKDGYISNFKLTNYNFLGKSSFIESIINFSIGGITELIDLFEGKFQEFLDRFFRAQSTGGNDNTHYGTEYLEGLYVDSKYNWDFRVEGTNTYLFYKFGLQNNTNKDTFESRLHSYFSTKILEYDEEAQEFSLKPIPAPEYYLYNKDYLYKPTSFKFSTPSTFNYCSKCINEFPNRIIWSEVSNGEDLEDFYRINLANNFANITGNKGGIVKLTYFNENLFIHTPYTTYIKRANPQILQTSESNLFIGTGEFLSLPEVELRETNVGYAGLTNIYGTSINEFGYQWIDGKRKQIINYTGNGIDIISQADSEWCKRYIEEETKLAFDPYFKRLMILDEKFTRSYDLLQNEFSSYHSYTPLNIVSTSNISYSVDKFSLSTFQKESNFGKYGENNVGCQIEISLPLLQTSYLDSIYYIADFEILDGIWKNTDSNFTEFWAYNDDQSTSKQSITVKKNEFDNVPFIYSSIETDKTYKISQIWDVANGQQVHNNEDHFKLPIQYNQNQFNLSRLRGKYVKVRLYFKSEEDVRLTLHALFVNNKPSIR